MKFRLNVKLLSVFVTVVFFAATSTNVHAHSWFYSGDTNLCSKCPDQAHAFTDGEESLLRLNLPGSAFSRTIGGGLLNIESSRLDFLPRIKVVENVSFLGPPKGSGNLSISANRNSDTIRFTDGRIVNSVLSMPEPATLPLLGTGLSGLAAAIWKRRKMVKDPI